MDFNKELDPDIVNKFNEARTSALKFAENFLIDPVQDAPFRATYPQKFILSSKKRDVWICVHRRAGKALPLTAQISTPEGNVSMKDISVGSLVLTPNGHTSTVTNVFPQGTKEVYRLYLDDGSYVDSCSEHEWEVYTKTCWKGGRGNSRQQYGNVIRTTKELMDSLTYCYSDRCEFNYKLNPIVPIPFSEKNLPIDPYLFGVLLGDGHFKTRSIVSVDPEIIETIVCRTKYSYREALVSQSSKAKRYFIISNELFQNIKLLNFKDIVGHQKHIPKDYLYGSIDQRIWLLRGLMDTDGSSNKRKGQAEYCTVSEQLAEDVAALARSLGCKVRIKKSEAAYTKNGIRKVTGFRYRLAITIPENLEIFNLERKKCGGLPERYLRRTIIKVEKLGTQVEMQCISIDDPSHLFITDNYTPTHNCIAEGALIINPDTLKPTPIELLSEAKKTLTFSFDSNTLIWSDCDWVNSGIKKCLKLNFASGEELILSDDHELFCSKRGWIRAEQLKVGDKILAPSSIPIFGDLEASLVDIEQEIEFINLAKRVGDSVYKYSKPSLELFIREFFLLHGRINHRDRVVVFMLWNRELALDIRHLLLRFGVISRVDSGGNIHIDTLADISSFLNIVGVDYLITEVNSSRSWDMITEIKHVGSRLVYDLVVDHEDHNFIANNLVVHNSYALSILALWHAIIKDNQKIVIYAPAGGQIDEFFDVLDKWFDKNEFLEALRSTNGNHKNPQKRTFINGSTISGKLMVLSSKIEGGRRGTTADVIILDEAQEFTEAHWKVVLPIMEGDKFRTESIRCYIAGTITKPIDYYYEKIYKIKPSSSEDRIFIPITQNKEYTPEQIERIRKTKPINTWTTEYLLEVGETEDSVFRKSDIERASRYDWSYGPEMIDHNKVRFIGVDWDKVQAGTNVAVFQYTPHTRDLDIIYREEVARDDYTYTNACNLIIDLFLAYTPELVITDQGQGEMQWEYLSLESQRRGIPLSERLENKAFNQKIEVPNPQTMEVEKNLIKPFLVGLLNKKLQENKFHIPSSDEHLINQLLMYKIKAQT